MAEKKTQMKPKQVKPKMQKKPNNKTVKTVKETKTMTEANKAKVQKATAPKPKTTKTTTKKPKTDKLIIEKHPENSDTGVIVSVDKDGNPKIIDLNPKTEEPKVECIKPESTTATHDGELGGDPCPCTTTYVPAEPELTVEDRLIKIFDKATMTVLTKNQIRESKKLYKTLGIDSLDRLDVAMAVEKEFNILFSKDDAIALTKHSFKDALKLVESYDSIGK